MRGLHFLLLLGIVLTAACSSWQQRRITQGEIPVVTSGRPVRVTRADGSTVVLERPQIVADSLVGVLETTNRRAAISLGDIRRLEEKRVSAQRTAGLTIGILAGVLIVVGALIVLPFVAS
jgi:hypothetical protein